MRLLRLFPDFARRFSPLWMIWLLIALVPVSREAAQLHILGTPLAEGYGQPWRQSFGRGREFNGFRAAKAKPRDLNAQLWRFSLMMRGSIEEEEDMRDSMTYVLDPQQAYKPEKLLHEAQAIQKAFPREKWLRSLPVRVMTERLDALSDKERASIGRFPSSSTANSHLSDVGASQIAPVVQNAAKSEPNNAYYALIEAEIWRRNSNPTAMWRALNRAAKCKVFETHDLRIRPRDCARA
ncbi:hypothetical protein B1R32_10424 [Abditibacterium utsteinense]|uniref:Uncharacterized protein n=1 Tax=Abditibacterium utsteinense TaxID=1960156 RepID=A0A2S8SUR5_9BACT|nr:hypothetical protein [Abditibacterium utsteinense]PQV64531.1 hypothetical protein B1R32_10424 [Abditibacterium utsteinense]